MGSPQKYPTGAQKWQLLKNFTLFGCGPSWTVYFETLLPAVGAAILMLIDTSVPDVARAVFSPKHPGFHHKRRGRKGKSGGPGLPQTEEIIGEIIGGEGLVDARRYSAGVQNVWRFDALAQEAGYYFLIADVFDEFYFEWISGIIARGASNCGQVHMTRSGGGDITGTASGEWVPIFLGTLISETGVLSHAGGVNLPAGTYNMILSGTVRNSGLYGAPGQFQVRFYNESADGDYTYSNKVQLYPGETASLVAQAVVTTDRGTHWECAKFGIAGVDSATGDFTSIEMVIIDLGVQAFHPPPPPPELKSNPHGYYFS